MDNIVLLFANCMSTMKIRQEIQLRHWSCSCTSSIVGWHTPHRFVICSWTALYSNHFTYNWDVEEPNVFKLHCCSEWNRHLWETTLIKFLFEILTLTPPLISKRNWTRSTLVSVSTSCYYRLAAMSCCCNIDYYLADI